MPPAGFARAFRRAVDLAPIRGFANTGETLVLAFPKGRSTETRRHCLTCGFADQAHPAGYFKARHGIPPAPYRKHFLMQNDHISNR